MDKIKLTTVGSSTGAVFPKELLKRLNLEKGDELFIMQTTEGLLLTPYDPKLKDQVEAGRAFMRDYRDTFKILAE